LGPNWDNHFSYIENDKAILKEDLEFVNLKDLIETDIIPKNLDSISIQDFGDHFFIDELKLKEFKFHEQFVLVDSVSREKLFIKYPFNLLTKICKKHEIRKEVNHFHLIYDSLLFVHNEFGDTLSLDSIRPLINGCQIWSNYSYDFSKDSMHLFNRSLPISNFHEGLDSFFNYETKLIRMDTIFDYLIDTFSLEKFISNPSLLNIGLPLAKPFSNLDVIEYCFVPFAKEDINNIISDLKILLSTEKQRSLSKKKFYENYLFLVNKYFNQSEQQEFEVNLKLLLERITGQFQNNPIICQKNCPESSNNRKVEDEFYNEKIIHLVSDKIGSLESLLEHNLINLEAINTTNTFYFISIKKLIF
jgi:hypothetical protein